MIVKSISKINSDYNEKQGESYWDYENYKINLGDIDDYYIYKNIGKGKYSEVFEGRTKNGDKCVIKVLKPVKERKILREIKILNTLKHKNIVEMIDVVRDGECDNYSLIFNYVEHVETRQFFCKIGVDQFKIYLKQLLEGLAYAHSKGIFHRDIKPLNLVVDVKNKNLRIIDWGLAEYYHPQKSYSVRVASRFYKGPELLVEYDYYDYSLDIWGVGCIIGEFITRKPPFFFGEDNTDQLLKIVGVLGKKDLMKYIQKYQIKLPKGLKNQIPIKNRKNLQEFLPNEISKSTNALLLVDLMEKMLVYDHLERITAEEALEHAFFK
ncbi:Casein kinase II alpha subunit [Spraguea lophii 42_110]|uniref:Casein kinase II subunit alpha n=1 Tax=Spraguea lophii (strain 42_110) TaxID=1358809 RepID=S7XSA9_SPRLO|nr:Casein kinase II alpha subunit [Spraguea lophii 42_110]